MLKLIDYNKSRIVLTYSDCNSINIDRVQSVSLSRVVDEGDISESIITYNQEDSKRFVKGENVTIAYEGLSFFDFTKINVTIYLSGNYTIEESSIGSNVITGSGILQDFSFSDYIKIVNTLYKIDRDYSTTNELTLNTPLTATSSTYQSVIIDLNYIFPLKAINKYILDNISKLNCGDCHNISNQKNYVISFMALQAAINCNDQQQSLDIFNKLKVNA